MARDESLVREESLRRYSREGSVGVSRWMAETGVTADDLRRAHAGDEEALSVIDQYWGPSGEGAGDFAAAVERYLGPLKGTPLYALHRTNLLDTGYHASQLRWYERFVRLEGCKVLDLGSGVGGMLLALADRGAALAVGVEIDPARHRLACLHTRGKPRIHCLFSPDGRVELPDRFVDVVICCHVVEHVEHAASLFGEIARVLKPAGLAFISCPNRFWPVEPHSGMPGLPLVPLPVAKLLASAIGRLPLLSASWKSRVGACRQLQHFFSARSLSRLASTFPFHVVAVNPEERFVTEHPRLARLAPCRPTIRRAFARFASWDLLVVAERAADP